MHAELFKIGLLIAFEPGSATKGEVTDDFRIKCRLCAQGSAQLILVWEGVLSASMAA